MKFQAKFLTALALCGALAACSNQAVYTGESFSSDSPFKLRVDGDIDAVCESARRALLGQGYLIDNANNESIKARKATRRGDSQSTFIEMNIVCLPESSGSTLFATGLLSEYALKKSTSSASVGVSALGSISVPIGQSADSLVKVSEETIDDTEFYQRFFAAVNSILEERRPPKPAADVQPPTEPGPGPQVESEEEAGRQGNSLQATVPATVLEPINLGTLPARRPETVLGPPAPAAVAPESESPQETIEQSTDAAGAQALENEETATGAATETPGAGETLQPEESIEAGDALPEPGSESLEPILEETEQTQAPLDVIRLLDV